MNMQSHDASDIHSQLILTTSYYTPSMTISCIQSCLEFRTDSRLSERRCFFFSSRRRHTRFDCDWSSDVCSSDLRDGRPGIRRQRLRDVHQRRALHLPNQYAPGETCGVDAAHLLWSRVEGQRLI